MTTVAAGITVTASRGDSGSQASLPGTQGAPGAAGGWEGLNFAAIAEGAEEEGSIEDTEAADQDKVVLMLLRRRDAAVPPPAFCSGEASLFRLAARFTLRGRRCSRARERCSLP